MFLEHVTRDGERWDSLAWQYYETRWAIPDYCRQSARGHHAGAALRLLLLIPVIEAEEARTEEDIAPWLR